MSSWFEKLVPTINTTDRERTVPEGLWTKCPECDAVLYRAELERNLNVCPKCDHHLRLNARQRLDQFLDADDREELGTNLSPVDHMRFKDGKRYKDRIVAAQKKTGERDALIAMRGKLKGLPVVVCAFEFNFMGGSMGSVVGERFVLAAKAALANRSPLICFTASGGARMQEALYSLLQMAKTSAVLAELSENRIPYVSVMTHPTTGGVSASLAMLGDINVAEPKALIGFAGPRVIKQTVKQDLPEGFQRSEFLLEHGAIDQIIDRREMRDRLFRILSMLTASPVKTATADSETQSETA